MFRPAPLSALAFMLILAILAAPVAADGEAGLVLRYRDHIRAELWLDGGDVVTVGEIAAAAPCHRGPRAFIERRGVDGTLRWSRPAGGGDQAFFAGPGAPDHATVVASTARDVTYDATSDSLIVVGELVQVTAEGARRSGFTAHLTTGGAVLGVVALGPPFLPGPPPPEAPTCSETCARLQQAGGAWWRPRAAAAGTAGDLYLTGSRRLENGADEAFLAAWTSSGQSLWSTALGGGEPGEGRALAVTDEAGGEVVYVTGSVGASVHKSAPVQEGVLVEKYDAAGGALASITASGPLPSAGDVITLTPQGPVVEGRFNGRLELGGEQIDAGACEERFRARFDRGLRPLQLETLPSLPTSQSRAEPQPPQLLGIEVIEGIWQGGGPCQLAASDDSYFTIAGDPVSETASQAVFIASYGIDPAAPPLTELSLELASDYCTTIALSLGVEGSPTFYLVGAGSVCPLGEPAATVNVPASILDSLGFAVGGTSAQDGLPLLVKVELTFYGAAQCGQGFCVSGAKDASVDELELGSGNQ